MNQRQERSAVGDGTAVCASSRREFFRALGRWSVWSLLAGGAAGLAARAWVGESTCSQPLPCRACAQLETCALPEAALARQVEQRAKHG